MEFIIMTRRENTVRQWNERLDKAKKKLENSRKCFEMFGDEDSKLYVEEDEKCVHEIEQMMQKAIDFMDKHGIK